MTAKKKRPRRRAKGKPRVSRKLSKVSVRPPAPPPPTGRRPPPVAGDLTDKQARFVAEYLVDLNGAAACRRAGYSETSADQQAYENLSKPQIAAAVAEGKARQMAACELSAVRVLEECRRLAFANVRDYFNVDGSAKHPNQLTAEEGAALAGFEVVIRNLDPGDGHTDTIHKFKLWDKPRVLELLAKHFKLVEEHVKVEFSVEDLAERLLAGQRRNAARR